MKWNEMQIIMSKGGEHHQKKVVVIVTSIDVSWGGVKWLLNALPLNPGDHLILLGLLQLINPRTLSLLAAAKICKSLYLFWRRMSLNINFNSYQYSRKFPNSQFNYYFLYLIILMRKIGHLRVIQQLIIQFEFVHQFWNQLK